MARKHANYASMKLNRSIGPNLEVWVRRMLVREIEDAYRETLESDTLNYYYTEFIKDDSAMGGVRSRIVWCGSGLLNFIRTVQRRRLQYVDLHVTSSRTKSGIVDQWDDDTSEMREVVDTNVIWIGDVGERGHMCCCNDAWNHLWIHVRDKKAKPAEGEFHAFNFEM
jgi:hypothetical protein